MNFSEIPGKFLFNEKVVSSKLHIFDECNRAFSEIIENDIIILEKMHSKTEKWGYVLRINFHSISDDGIKLPASSFICWKKPGYSENIAISPLED
jgi:hypothetical protein